MCDRKQGPLLVTHGLGHALQLSFRGQGPQVGTGAPREASSALWTLALVLSSRGWRKHGVLGLCSEPGPEPSRGGCGQSSGNDIGYVQSFSLKLFLLNKHRNGYFWHFESSGTGESLYINWQTVYLMEAWRFPSPRYLDLVRPDAARQMGAVGFMG